ncbi:hypothetical protein MRB53_038947 [Persea americana]|nr:hypothetical protein MRB53_038947 [Persea americana]
MGVGKESDIYLVTVPAHLLDPSSSHDDTPTQAILKLHRLGRTSFRSAGTTRSYTAPSKAHARTSWQRLSCLSAAREASAMRSLHDAGFPVPRCVAHSRHAVVMALVPGVVLRNVPLSAFGELDNEVDESAEQLQEPDSDVLDREKLQRDERVASLYASLINLALDLASRGVIHGDLNEFNILIENVPDAPFDPPSTIIDTKAFSSSISPDISSVTPKDRPSYQHQPPMIPHLIDFPQITSIHHFNAASHFDRDITCIKTYFRRRYHFEAAETGPTFEEALDRRKAAEAASLTAIDREMEAAGWRNGVEHGRSKTVKKAEAKDEEELEGYYGATRDEEGTSEADGADEDEVREDENYDEGGHGLEDVNGNGELMQTGSEPQQPGALLPLEHVVEEHQSSTRGPLSTPANESIRAPLQLDPSTPADMPLRSGLSSLTLSSLNSQSRQRPKAAAGWAI